MLFEDQIKALQSDMNGDADEEQLDENLDSEAVDDDTQGDSEVDQDEQEGDDDDEQTSEGDDDGDDDDTEQPNKDSEKDPVIEWKTASGEVFKVAQSELKNGYMRQQDYTRDKQELAKERQTVTQTIQQQFAEVEKYASEIGALKAQETYITQLEQAAQQSANDPARYQSIVTELLLARQERDGIANRIGQVRQQRTFEQQQHYMQAQKQAVEALSKGPDALPNFGPELVKKMNDTGKQYGLTEQELSGITDPKYIRILHDAMKYRELQASKPQAVRKVKAAPSKQVRSSAPPRVAKVIESFDKNPSISSMAALMSATKSRN